MINNLYIKIYENWFITTGMPRQERKNTTEPCWARMFMRSGNKVVKIGEKMPHILSYNLYYKNGDHRNKQSAHGAVARGGPIFTLGPILYAWQQTSSSTTRTLLKPT